MCIFRYYLPLPFLKHDTETSFKNNNHNNLPVNNHLNVYILVEPVYSGCIQTFFETIRIHSDDTCSQKVARMDIKTKFPTSFLLLKNCENDRVILKDDMKISTINNNQLNDTKFTLLFSR